MRKKFVFVLGIFLLTFFSSFFNFFDTRTPSTKIAHKIANHIGEKLNKKYKVQNLGISESGRNGKYIILGLELSYKHILSKDEGRKLLLKCVKEALDTINVIPQFKQYMVNFPFTGDNIRINIYIQPPNVSRVLHPDIASFSFYDSTLHYHTRDPENKFRFFSKEEESFEEAMRLVESQK